MSKTLEGALVEAARTGDEQAFGRLFDTWFDRVHDLSRRIVRDPGIAGEVAQDAFLTAWTRLDSLQDPDAFGGWLLRIARNKSLNRLEKERRSVALDDETMTTLTDLDAPDGDPLAHLDQAGRIALVWDAAAALGERDMSILDLHLRHGLGAGELAEELGTTANNAHQILFTLRKRLGTNVAALVLWRAGRPRCENLRQVLQSAGIGTFDKQAVKAIERHAAVCDECSRDRTEQLSPAALFGAAPVVAAPFLLKSQAAAALEAAGVPMAGSVAASGKTVDPSPSNSNPSSGGRSGPRRGSASGPGPGDHSTPASSASEEATRRRRTRVLTVAALVAVLVTLTALLALGGDTGGDEHQTELAAGSGSTSPDDTDATTADTSESTTTVASTSSVDDGGFVVIGEDPEVPTTETVPGTTPQSPPTSSAPSTVPPPPPTQPPGTIPTPPTTTATTRPTTTTQPPAVVMIIDFRAVTVQYQCKGGLIWQLSWITSGAESVTYSVVNGTPNYGSPNDTVSMCVPYSRQTIQFELTAKGRGGEVTTWVDGVVAVP